MPFSNPVLEQLEEEYLRARRNVTYVSSFALSGAGTATWQLVRLFGTGQAGQNNVQVRQGLPNGTVEYLWGHSGQIMNLVGKLMGSLAGKGRVAPAL